MSIKPDYYKTWVDVRNYSGCRLNVSVECNDLAISLANKNKLSIKQAWYYMLAIKYIFRFNNKDDPIKDLDKAITCLEQLKYEMEKRIECRI